MKPTTDFSKLPILTITDTRDKKFTISHELAILGFVGRVRAEMAGETHDDWSISTQLMGECEDVYGKLTNFQPTTFSSARRGSPTSTSASVSRVEDTLLRFTPSGRPSPRRSSLTTPNTLTRPPRLRSRKSSWVTTGPCWSPTPVGVSPRSSEEGVLALVSRNPTVKCIASTQ